MKTDLLQSCGHCWVFQMCWHIECSTFTASSSRIWNSSTRIPSPPLALFVVMLSKPYLTSHSRMLGSRWVITPSWLSGLWRSFLYSSSVYSCHLFLISSASVRSIPFLSFIEPIFARNVLLVSLIFLKRSLVFPILLFSSIFFALITEEGFLISSCCSLELCIQMLIQIFPFLLCFSLLFFALIIEEGFLISSCYSLELCIQMGISFLFFFFLLLFFSQLFVRPPQTAILLFCISFSWRWSWFLSPVQCHEPPSIVLQALCLSDLISWIYLSLPLYNHKGFDLGLTWIV